MNCNFKFLGETVRRFENEINGLLSQKRYYLPPKLAVQNFLEIDIQYAKFLNRIFLDESFLREDESLDHKRPKYIVHVYEPNFYQLFMIWKKYEVIINGKYIACNYNFHIVLILIIIGLENY